MEEFERLVADFKEDLQREANQWVLKKDVHQAASALYAIDAVNTLAHRVVMRAFHSQEAQEEKPKKQVLFHRRTKKQMEEARAAAAKVREIPKKVG